MTNQTIQHSERWTRDYIFDVLREIGIHYIFGVPGTNEIPIIDGTSYPENQVQYIECLHENIAIGAAMGSARMSGKPGVVVVHVTPGIAHSIGNLFNAWRSHIPLVILCCQQQNELVTQEPLLASNLVHLAQQYTKLAHEVRTPEEIPLVLQRSFKEAMAPPNGPVFISMPWEFNMRSISADDRIQGVTQISPHFTGDRHTIKQAATLLAQARNPIIIAGDAVGYADAWSELQELAQLLGAPVLLQTFSSVANFPNNDFHWQGELPGAQEKIQEVFKNHDVAFLCGFGCQAQVTVFKYSSGPLIPPTVRQVYLTNNSWDLGKNYYGEAAIFGDIKATLPLINNLIGQNPPAEAPERNDKLQKQDAQRHQKWQQYLELALTQDEIWAVVVADALREEIHKRGLEKRFVYVHEAVSDPAPFQYFLPLGNEESTPISYYCVAGGSLGWSMPASLGIKLESTGWQGIETSLVVNAVGDGSSLFYPQTWWTAAHRQLGVLYIIMNNQEYRTLQMGLEEVVHAYSSTPGYGWKPKTNDPEYLRIERPKFDFVNLAKAFGAQDGAIVNHPQNVSSAVQLGIDYVLKTGRSYILDVRTAKETPLPLSIEERSTRYTVQPPLNFFHQMAANVPLIS
ncbi:thiamine pyrophosphate binding domain-containing protein [Cylindrospermum sp. NIES-4074]|nr:thiamine pyrophosphate binding domain-containing protein [Cylindrospermum sp. NIES-4074]